MRINMIAPTSTIEATDTGARTLRGIAVPYGQPGDTSAGRVVVDAGAVRVPANLRAVKLFREHGRETPLGYGLDAADSDEALRMGFVVARNDDGDRALLEASEGLRDAFSVELSNVEIRAGHVIGADLVAVAQVALPAFAGAQLNAADTPVELDAALTDEEQAKVHDLATQITEATAPEDTEEEPETDTPPEGTAAMTEQHTIESSRPVGMSPPRPAQVDVVRDQKLWAASAAEALRGATDAADVNRRLNAALADITPAASTTDVFPRPAWLGELWTPQAAARPLVDAIGVQALTAMTMQGWKWETEPVVAPYAGNKAAIPTSPATVVPASADAHRIAGGWDLDRIYVDFNTGFMEAFQAAAVRDYRRKSQGYFINGHGAITGPPAIPAAEGILTDATDLGAQTSLLAAIQAVVGFLTGNGATVSFIAMASDAYQDFFAVTSGDAPWWLSGQSSINLNGTSDIAGTTVVVEPSLPAGTVLGGDRDAVSLYETGPINVNAVNLPNGGVDYALFGYWAQLVHDNDGLAKATVTSTATAARNAGNARNDDGGKRKAQS
jgi:hypothetical protein